MSNLRVINFESIKEMTVAELVEITLNSGFPLTVKLSNGRAICIEIKDLESVNDTVTNPIFEYGRTAIISDIHGHWQGLQLVLEDMRSREVDRIVCLGDVVEGGDEDETVVDYLQQHKITTIRGNHDEENDCQLPTEQQQWLNHLPELIVEKDVFFTHISPRLKKQKITNQIEAWNVFDDCDFRLCFIGHIHFPAMFGKKHAPFGESCAYEVDAEAYQLDESDRYIISFGAIAYPRGGGKYLRYGIFDASRNVVEFIRLEGPLLPYGLCRPIS
ncbi:MAG: metallophosphoesterase family protein [Microcystaceae cyanobacterium]